jgi:hypothetical protein
LIIYGTTLFEFLDCPNGNWEWSASYLSPPGLRAYYFSFYKLSKCRPGKLTYKKQIGRANKQADANLKILPSFTGSAVDLNLDIIASISEMLSLKEFIRCVSLAYCVPSHNCAQDLIAPFLKKMSRLSLVSKHVGNRVNTSVKEFAAELTLQQALRFPNLETLRVTLGGADLDWTQFPLDILPHLKHLVLPPNREKSNGFESHLPLFNFWTNLVTLSLPSGSFLFFHCLFIISNRVWLSQDTYHPQ